MFFFKTDCSKLKTKLYLYLLTKKIKRNNYIVTPFQYGQYSGKMVKNNQGPGRELKKVQYIPHFLM